MYIMFSSVPYTPNDGPPEGTRGPVFRRFKSSELERKIYKITSELHQRTHTLTYFRTTGYTLDIVYSLQCIIK